MKKNGYFLIKPPLLEFESSLFFLTNEKDNIDSFRLLDPISQKMMGIRPDITLQIARIACGSLNDSPRPLRLCYSGEILKANNNGLNLSRQITQIGSEIIGIEKNFCEKEVIDLIIETLKKLKIKKFFINFTMPTLIESLSKDFNLSKSNIDFIKEKFRNKNYNEIKNISKKIDNRGLFIFHTKIRKNSFVKITNPENTKTVIAQVISNKAIFSNFYNSVITKRIVDELLLDENEPYVELSLISNESTFVAKKAKTFDEEKKVAQKAPVDGITIDNLGTVEKKELPKTSQSNFLYSIKIADFYYKDSAENMIQRIMDETKITNPVIKKLSQTKYRVLLGPFNDIKKIQESFDEIEKLNFENLKIIKDV